MAQKVSDNDKEQLIKIAKTSMQTKLVSKESEDAELVVNAIYKFLKNPILVIKSILMISK